MELDPETELELERERARRRKTPAAPPSDAAPEEPSAVDLPAAGRGFGQGASFGFADELAGVLKAAQAKGLDFGQGLAKTGIGRSIVRQLLPAARTIPNDALDAMVAKAADETRGDFGLKDGLLQNYRAGRDEERSANDEAKARSPWQYGGGELAGAVMAPGPKVAKGAKGAPLLARAAAYAKAAAPVGAAFGAGQSKADLTQGDVGGEARDVAAGAGSAALAAGTLGPLLERGGSKLADMLRQRANLNALKASGLSAGISNKLKALGITTESGAQDLGQAARDLGVVRFGRTPADVSERLGGVLAENASKKAESLAAADAAGGFSGQQAGWDMVRDLAPGTNPVRDAASAKALDMAQQVGAAGDTTFAAADKMRADLGKSVPWNAAAFAQSSPLTVDMQRSAYMALRNAIRKQAGTAAGPAVEKALEEADKQMSVATDLQALAQNEATRAPARKAWSKALGLLMTAMGAGVGQQGGAPVEGAIGGFLAAAAGDALAPRVPSAMAVTQGALSKAIPAVTDNPEAQTAATRALALKAAALRRALQQKREEP